MAVRTASTMLAATVSIGAAAPGFSFRAIEFAPAQDRVPAARAFLARVAAPGTPLDDAERAIVRAGAACRRPRSAAAPILCHAARPIARSDEDGLLDDVTWTVRLTRAADGTVAAAEVTRDRYGD